MAAVSDTWYMCDRDCYVVAATYDHAPKCRICCPSHKKCMTRLPEYIQAAGRIGGSETVKEMAFQVWVEPLRAGIALLRSDPDRFKNLVGGEEAVGALNDVR